ncbi:MAG: amidase [Dehalococcoidia bacterium]|nr:amidase [Dehalococcoidia bacterium]MDW8120204.1 amidase [Chloroflexota bacterium]
MHTPDLAYTPAWRLREMILARQISPVEVTRFFLQRIERLNPRLNAYLTVTAQEALAQARQAEEKVMRGEALGLLHGLPVSVKDLIPTQGIRTTFGSLAFQTYIPTQDAVVVERVKRAGGIILGKTNTSELGLGAETINRLGGPCGNPWDPSRTAGGSSGGAASAVAAGLGPLAIGSDGGGSIRIPAAMCGVFGFKPSRGRIPRTGGIGRPVSNLYSHIGPLTWTVKDAALLMQALSGYDARDVYALRGAVPDFLGGLEGGVRGLRIAWSATLGYAAVDPEVEQVCRSAAQVFGDLGAVVDEPPLRLEHPFPYFLPLYHAMWFAAYGHLLAEQGALLAPETRTRIAHGSQVTIPQYLTALRQMEQMAQQMDDILERYDLLLTPTVAVPAFPHGQRPTRIAGQEVDPIFGFYPFTALCNMTGQPAASVPCGFSREGLPIGLHIIGRRNEDTLVLRAAYALEQARPWQGRRPPLA